MTAYNFTYYLIYSSLEKWFPTPRKLYDSYSVFIISLLEIANVMSLSLLVFHKLNSNIIFLCLVCIIIINYFYFYSNERSKRILVEAKDVSRPQKILYKLLLIFYLVGSITLLILSVCI